MKKTIKLSFILPLLASCSSTFDMQGHDPREYYAQHPIENKVEAKNILVGVQFENGKNNLSDVVVQKLKSDLQDVSVGGVKKIELKVSPVMQSKQERVVNLRKIMKSLGYIVPMPFNTDAGVRHGEILLDVSYYSVVSPNCPDWRKSPVTTYSNTMPANYGCATTVNLGLMVDDPRDLEFGKGDARSNTERGVKVLGDYKAGTTDSSSAATPVSVSGN